MIYYSSSLMALISLIKVCRNVSPLHSIHPDFAHIRLTSLANQASYPALNPSQVEKLKQLSLVSLGMESRVCDLTAEYP